MKILGWIIAIPFILFIVWGIGRLLFCGPDESIRKVTDPLAKSILEYVNENGEPESLLDIKTLPYKVEECKKFERVRKSLANGLPLTRVSQEENCIVKLDKKHYSITINNKTDEETEIYTFSLHIRNKNTRIHYYADQKKINSFEKELKLDKPYTKYIKVPYLCKNGYLSLK